MCCITNIADVSPADLMKVV